MQPRELSLELRRGSGRYLGYRRGVVLLSLVSMGCMELIALYQMGIIRHVPDPPLPMMNGDKVNGSDEAYSHLEMGDAFLGMGSYSLTAALAAAGPKERATSRRWLPLALAAKAAVDAVQAGRLTYDQFAKQKAACFWCLLATASTFAAAFLSIPEAKAAMLKTGRDGAISA